MNKSSIIKAFNKASTGYDKYAAFQRQVGYDLINFAKLKQSATQKTLLDAGCGTGYFSRYLQAQGYHVTALDFASNMLQQAKENLAASHYIQADLADLSPIKTRFDVTFSNLALQWCDAFDVVIDQLYQKTNQMMLFSTIVDDSLYELNHCRYLQNPLTQGNCFLPHKTVLAALAPYALTWQINTYKLVFPSIMPLLLSLKGVGATYQYNYAKSGLSTMHYFNELEAIYYKQYGELRLTYHIFCGVIHCG